MARVRRASTEGQPVSDALAREEAQTMAEYALVLAVITPLLVAIFGALGTNVGHWITEVAERIDF